MKHQGLWGNLGRKPNVIPSNTTDSDGILRVCLLNSSLVSYLAEPFNYSSCESCEEACPFAREVRLPRKSNKRIGQLREQLQKPQHLNTTSPWQVTCFRNFSDPNLAIEAVSESLLSGFRIYCAREDVARYLMLAIIGKNVSQQCLAQTQRFNKEMRCIFSRIDSTNIFHEANLRPELFAKYRRGNCASTLSGLTYAQAVHEHTEVTAESVAATTHMSKAEKLAAAAVTRIKRRENITASWTLIHKGRACMNNTEGIRRSGSNATLKSVEGCKESCLVQADCVAVDWNDETKLCNFFNEPCSEPQTEGTVWSSYQYAEHLIFWISECSNVRINGPWVPAGRRANRARYMRTEHDDLIIEYNANSKRWELLHREVYHKVSDVLGGKVLYVSYSESFGVPLRNWVIPEGRMRMGNVLKINFPASLEISNAGTRYLNGKWAITSTHGLQPRYELLEHGSALMEWSERLRRWLIFKTKNNAVKDQMLYRSMLGSDSRIPPKLDWQVATWGQDPAPVIDQVEDDVLTRLQEEGAFDVSRPVLVLWSGFNDDLNKAPLMTKKALDDFVMQNGFVALHNHGYSSRSAIGQLLAVKGVDGLSACGSDLTKPLWETWSEILIASMLKTGVRELIIAVGNKTADNINQTILYRNELALLGKNWPGITYSMRVLLLLMQGRCYELGQKIEDHARIANNQDYVCMECGNKSLDACYAAAMDVSEWRRITH